VLFAGFSGIAVGVATLVIMWIIAYLGTSGTSFDFDPQGETGAFEKLLAIYLDLSKSIIGLAAGSIVLLVGSSAFRSSGRLPESFASPLFLLGLSIIWGILFMMFLALNYEDYRHHPNSPSYTRFRYARNQALGFAELLCFCIGYTWLIFAVTR
jgi:hypothetical protein